MINDWWKKDYKKRKFLINDFRRLGRCIFCDASFHYSASRTLKKCCTMGCPCDQNQCLKLRNPSPQDEMFKTIIIAFETQSLEESDIRSLLGEYISEYAITKEVYIHLGEDEVFGLSTLHLPTITNIYVEKNIVYIKVDRDKEPHKLNDPIFSTLDLINIARNI